MTAPVVILASDPRPGDPAAGARATGLRASAARALGVTPAVDLARLPGGPAAAGDPGDDLGRVIDRHAAAGADLVLVLPDAFGLNAPRRVALGEELVLARRRHPAVAVHHDDPDPCHPLLIDAFTGLVLRALAARGVAPRQAGLVLVADGRGDAGTRADAYRLMRLVLEQAGVARADVGFVRHEKPFLRDTLERCPTDPPHWVLLPLDRWPGELTDYAGVVLADHRRAHPRAAGWELLDPPGDHPAVIAWLEQRLLRLWKEKRAAQAARAPSARRQADPAPAGVWSGSGWVPAAEAAVAPRAGLVGRAREPAELAAALRRVLPPAERYLVKVTWHGYAPGTYTGPAALDLLLGALPGRAVVLEGHTSGRNAGGRDDIDWEGDARPHRGWVRQQEVEFLRRTGLADVIARHKAQYLNVTEAWWDGACAPADEVLAALGGVELRRPELAGFVPSALLELRGAPLVSFARFKGPTRLALSNLFGLIPHPLRTAWHGPAPTAFASVCCDLALLYGGLFPPVGLVEAFDSAVRWDRRGLYRSRWGNYDLVPADGLFALSEGLAGADILASRLQGQDVTRSGFYGVVRERLGWPPGAAELPLPGDVLASLA